ncbi:MAG: hypothetical protein M3Q60_20020, partial [Actinomycetota bacterium]|nr:hypothetical protein [Actinomycetota bacterium]
HEARREECTPDLLLAMAHREGEAPRTSAAVVSPDVVREVGLRVETLGEAIVDLDGKDRKKGSSRVPTP